MYFWIMRRPAVTDRTRLTRRGVLAGATLAGVAGIVGTRLGTANAAPVGTLAPAATSNLALTSSNSQLVADFAWAKQRALDWVQTGKKAGYIPCYWAGLTTRPAFYSRDFAHQATGAHLLGLDTENLSMLRTFAASATSARKYYPLWSFGFDGSIYATDYHSDTNFVREIPAVFELTQKGVEQYLWAGNRAYVDDAKLFAYYTNSVNAFVTAHDDNHNGIADEKGTGSIFRGVASYNENKEKLLEAGDAVGSQYQALRAYAIAQAARGDQAGADKTNQRAAALKAQFEKNWYSTSAKRYIRAFNAGGALTNFGKENSWFMPMKEITSPGTRTNQYLDFVDSSVSALPPFNIEAYTYLPETFFRWGRIDQGWKWLQYVAKSRAAYPEISYTMIGNYAEGLLGIRPNAPADALSTLANLPGAVGWLQLDHVRLGQHDLAVRHTGATTSILTHHGGPRPVTWTAQFAGQHATLRVNGAPRPATVQTISGRVISSVDVAVAAGAIATVTT
jgi:hypothetical protein